MKVPSKTHFLKSWSRISYIPKKTMTRATVFQLSVVFFFSDETSGVFRNVFGASRGTLGQDTCTDKVRVETLAQGVQDMQKSINEEPAKVAMGRQTMYELYEIITWTYDI